MEVHACCAVAKSKITVFSVNGSVCQNLTTLLLCFASRYLKRREKFTVWVGAGK